MTSSAGLSQRLAKWLRSALFGRKTYKFAVRNWQELSDMRLVAEVLASQRFSRTLQPVEMAAPRGKRILVMAPHPDDEMIGPGGTLIRAIANGRDVHVVYLTGGAAEDARLRAETEEAAALVGYGTTFMPYRANAIQLDAEAVDRLATVIRDTRPDVLFLPFFCDDHDDHRRAGHLLHLLAKRDPKLREMEVWAYQVYSSLFPNVVVDITEHAEKKRQAIACWASQTRRRDWAHFALGLNAYNSRLVGGAADPRYVEAFFVLPLRDYAEMCAPYYEAAPGEIYYAPHYRQPDRP